jgi:hypothetical protein
MRTIREPHLHLRRVPALGENCGEEAPTMRRWLDWLGRLLVAPLVWILLALMRLLGFPAHGPNDDRREPKDDDSVSRAPHATMPVCNPGAPHGGAGGSLRPATISNAD